MKRLFKGGINKKQKKKLAADASHTNKLIDTFSP